MMQRLMSSLHVRSPVFRRGAQVLAQLVGVICVEEDLRGRHHMREHVLPAHTLPPADVTLILDWVRWVSLPELLQMQVSTLIADWRLEHGIRVSALISEGVIEFVK